MNAEQSIEHTPGSRRQILYTLGDAWAEWLAGNKLPIAFFGDSTFDGANTTDWTRNSLGTDNRSPNAFSKKLEDLLQEATNNRQLRIYNAGFSGQTARWAETVLEDVFGEQSAYRDVKMIGIGFGINDRLIHEDVKAYRAAFKQSITRIIHWCYSKGIQPFLLTSQATVEPGVMGKYLEMYPMRTSEYIHSIANTVKKELAHQFGLALIDLNAYTESFLLYSSVSTRRIISDRLHFGDIGHQYEAELLFAHLCPRTILADGFTKIDFSSQRVFDCVREELLTMPEEPEGPFKVYADFVKEDASDLNMMSAWIFVNAKRKLTLKAFKGDHASKTYVLVNGTPVALTGLETEIGSLELGLYRLDVRSGEGTKADFRGFLLE